MKRILLFSLMLLLILPVLSFGQDSLAHTVYCTLLVPQPGKTAAFISDWAEKEGGYYLVQSEKRVVVRFPKERLPDFEDLLESLSEGILERNQSAVDLLERIQELRAGIEAREEILNRNLGFLDRADVKGTLAIEREVASLLREIENLKGRLRKAELDSRMVYGEINLVFQTQELPEKIPSSFPWVNTLDFFSFIGGGF